jgi:hypothetical protein
VAMRLRGGFVGSQGKLLKGAVDCEVNSVRS